MSRISGFKHSEKTKQKIGFALKGKSKFWLKGENNPMKKLENRKKISEARKGMKFTEEHKRNMGLSRKGKITWIKGKHHSIESINKIKIARLKQRGLLEPHLNRLHSEFTKLKLRIARSKRILPMKDTKIEVKIQSFLRLLGIEFYTHQYIKEIEHSYQCDILIPSMNMILECDGDYWHKYPFRKDIDLIRSKELLEKGFKVLRLWENEIESMDLNTFKEYLNQVDLWNIKHEIISIPKAKLILANIEEIKKFVEDNSN